MIVWREIERLMGWDSGTSFGYLFHSGSGATLEILIWGSILWFWRTSCQAKRWCLRHAHHEVTDPESSTTSHVCWYHAGLSSKYSLQRIRDIQAKHKLLYLGHRPGRG